MWEEKHMNIIRINSCHISECPHVLFWLSSPASTTSFMSSWPHRCSSLVVHTSQSEANKSSICVCFRTPSRGCNISLVTTISLVTVELFVMLPYTHCCFTSVASFFRGMWAASTPQFDLRTFLRLKVINCKRSKLSCHFTCHCLWIFCYNWFYLI